MSFTISNAPRPGDEAPALPPLTLGEIRHACHTCGTCCTGWRVRLSTTFERQRVQNQAEVLGIRDPITDASIRRENGRCVFLREDNLCAIHARFGEDEKPTVCQHFPRRSRHAEDGMRIGADPGCSSSWRTFKDGPIMQSWSVKSARPIIMQPDRALSERSLISMCLAPDMTMPLFIALMTGDPSDMPRPNEAFARRILSALGSIAPVISDADNGPHLNAALGPLGKFIAAFDPAAPLPAWHLPPESDAFARDLIQRYLFIRIGDDTLPPVGHVMLLVGGILALAYIDPTPSVFGPALSAWSRITRLPNLWEMIMPDRDAAQAILYGPPRDPPREP